MSEPSSSAPPGVLGLLGTANFGRLFVAGLTSTAGSSIAGLCITWLVFQSTGSALSLAYYAAAAILGSVSFSLLGGTLVDRYDRRRLLLVADYGRALLVSILAFSLWFWRFDLLVVLPISFGLSALFTLFDPAERTLLPSLVGGSSLARANALVQSGRSSVAFVGVGIAGFVLAFWSAPVGIGVNALTFLTSAVLITGVRVPPRIGPLPTAGPRTSMATELRAGFAYLRRELGLLELTLSAMFFNFFDTIVMTFLVAYVILVLHGTPLLFALVIGANVLGGVAGSFLAAHFHAARRAGLAWVLAYGIGGGACAVVLGFVPPLPIVVITAAALGTLATFAGIAWLTGAQRYVPSEYQGRYFGIDNLGSIAILPAGQLGGGLLIDRFGVGPTYLVAGIGWTIAGAVFLLFRALRRWGDGTSPGAGASLPDPPAE